MGVGITGDQYLWPRRTIPCRIEPGFPDPERIFLAIRHWHDHTSIRFVPHGGETDYVLIKRLPGRSVSDVGRRGGEQKVQLDDETPWGKVAHELGHVVGLWHEHCRNQRDDWIHIDLGNVAKKDRPNFFQNSVADVPTPMTDLGGYDYGSLMHYGPKDCALYKEDPVLTAKKPLPEGVVMGQRESLSAGDIAAVEEMYANEPMPTDESNSAALAAWPVPAAPAPAAPAPAAAPAAAAPVAAARVAAAQPAAAPAAAARATSAGGSPPGGFRALLAMIFGRLRGKASTTPA